MLIQRDLIYTGITRAKQMLVLGRTEKSTEHRCQE
jgi:ATP-dependent exoDNAse (exonuclease V) alpha subunit